MTEKDCSQFEVNDGQFFFPLDINFQKKSDQNNLTSTAAAAAIELSSSQSCQDQPFKIDKSDNLQKNGGVVAEDLAGDESSSENQTIHNESYPTNDSSNQTAQRNDSKNVPKGMMKALAKMILDKRPRIVKILRNYFDEYGLSFQEFKQRMRKIRKSAKILIKDIKNMLLNEEFSNAIRTIGCYFLRKRFLNHIFNSKMKKTHLHLKYISRWMEIFKNPGEFVSLK